MKKICLAALALCCAPIAYAADQAAPAATPAAGAATGAPDFAAQQKMMEETMKSAVEESKKLAPLAGSFTMTGKSMANAMGPGSPEMTTKGKGKCAWVQGGLYLNCEWQETYGTGKNAHTMSGNYLIGYDPMAKGYRMAAADMMGTGVLTGTLEGKTATFESAPMEMNGHKMAIKLGWDWSDAKAIKFTMWNQMDGGPWNVGEESTGKKAGGAS